MLVKTLGWPFPPEEPSALPIVLESVINEASRMHTTQAHAHTHTRTHSYTHTHTIHTRRLLLSPPPPHTHNTQNSAA